MNRLFESESGYSLVEVLASIMILTIAIIPMVGMFDAGLRTAVIGSNYDKGRALANAKLEEVKALTYSQVEDRYPPSGSSHEPATIDGFDFEITTRYVNRYLGSPSTTPNGCRCMRVEVEVSWDRGDKEFETTGYKIG